jgi:hypothetical protein
VNGSQPANGYIGSCARHRAEHATGHCQDCGEAWCAQCLVPPASKRQPLRCVSCALVAAGVRTRSPRAGGPMNMNRSNRSKALFR